MKNNDDFYIEISRQGGELRPPPVVQKHLEEQFDSNSKGLAHNLVILKGAVARKSLAHYRVRADNDMISSEPSHEVYVKLLQQELQAGRAMLEQGKVTAYGAFHDVYDYFFGMDNSSQTDQDYIELLEQVTQLQEQFTKDPGQLTDDQMIANLVMFDRGVYSTAQKFLIFTAYPYYEAHEDIPDDVISPLLMHPDIMSAYYEPPAIVSEQMTLRVGTPLDAPWRVYLRQQSLHQHDKFRDTQL